MPFIWHLLFPQTATKKIFNDDFLTKKEYNFLYQVAIEKQDRNAIEIISDCISD
jgi:hypothetical protein